MVETNLLTEKEKERIARHISVQNRYRELREAYPECSDNRLYMAIAAEQNLSIPGVRKIVLSAQLQS